MKETYSSNLTRLFMAFVLFSTSLQALKIISAPGLMDTTTQPVIGILTIFPSAIMQESIGDVDAYVPSSYKKWVEQTGARAIPIPHFLPQGMIKRLLKQVNGLFFPGGAPDLIL